MNPTATSLAGESKPFRLEEKRFYVNDYSLHSVCPKCGRSQERDFSEDYLSYPMANEAIKVLLECSNYDGDLDLPPCKTEWPVWVRINVTMELVAEPAGAKES